MDMTWLLNSICRSRYISLGSVAFLIVAPAVLCAFKYAGDGLNADIILNQIMSAQKLTLFYWGQNRLLNIVPFCLSFIKWPLLNLFCLLLFSTTSFFAALYLSALFANRLLFSHSGHKNGILLYLGSIGVCAILFTNEAWVSIVLWHFEYTLSLVLLLVGGWLYYGCKGASLSFFPLAFLALGLNPALLLLGLSVIALKVLVNRYFNKLDVLFCGWIVICFLFWWIAGGVYGSNGDYSAILPANFQRGLEKLLSRLFSDYLRPGTFALMVVAALLLGLMRKYNADIRGESSQEARRLAAICIIAAIVYSIFIACIRWVEMNDFAPRYLIPSLLMAFFATQCMCVRYLCGLTYKMCLSAACLLGLLLLFFFWPSSFDLMGARIYRDCEHVVSPGERFYAGDYWQTWACVSRDLNHGFGSHGLSYRSSSNRENIRLALDQRLEKTQELELYCLGAEPDVCQRDLAEHLPDFELASIEQHESHSVLFIHRKGEPGKGGKANSSR